MMSLPLCVFVCTTPATATTITNKSRTCLEIESNIQKNEANSLKKTFEIYVTDKIHIETIMFVSVFAITLSVCNFTWFPPFCSALIRLVEEFFFSISLKIQNLIRIQLNTSQTRRMLHHGDNNIRIFLKPLTCLPLENCSFALLLLLLILSCVFFWLHLKERRKKTKCVLWIHLAMCTFKMTEIEKIITIIISLSTWLNIENKNKKRKKRKKIHDQNNRMTWEYCRHF